MTGYKQTYSITSMVLPQEVKDKLAAGFRSAESTADQISESEEAHGDIFSFDLPEKSPSAPVKGNDDPFNFNTPSHAVNRPGSAKPGDDVFADLLESTSQTEESPFAATPTATSSAAAKSADSSSSPGEFDLESFSWDDTPSAPAAGENSDDNDDFDTLFGDTKENPQK